jgi:hypothetical protein
VTDAGVIDAVLFADFSALLAYEGKGGTVARVVRSSFHSCRLSPVQVRSSRFATVSRSRERGMGVVGMPLVRGIVVGVAGAILAITLAGCRPALANEALSASDNQPLATVSGKPALQHADETVWGRVPYCSCLADSATANVAGALKKDNLTVSLQEQSPRDGWLYFVATFDSHSATWDQVNAAIVTGGGQVVEGPP